MENQLQKVASDIWIVEGKPVQFYGFAYPTRSVIVRLKTGGLWFWSPIDYSDELKAEIDAIGTPAFLVSPNKIHHLFLSDWVRAYPKAQLCGPKSTIEKRNDLNFEIELNDVPPKVWSDEIDQVWFNGSSFMDEVVFFHHASSTAILADLSENFDEKFLKKNWSLWQRAIANLWGIVDGKGYAPLEWRLSFRKKQQTRASRDRVLAWNPEKVIMAHGKWQKAAGRQFLEKSFSWM